MTTRMVPRQGMIRRLALLYGGLILSGFSFAMFVQADLGLDPWNVFHQGISETTGRTIGSIVVVSSAVVLLLWIPLRQKPGLGTLSDVAVVGIVMDFSLRLMPFPETQGLRFTFLIAALLLNGLAVSLYLGAGLGPGPRDGLMTGLAARGWSIRSARVAIDASVLTVGWVLGGTVGIGTVASALIIGPVVGYLLPRIVASNASPDHIPSATSPLKVAPESWSASIGKPTLAATQGELRCD